MTYDIASFVEIEERGDPDLTWFAVDSAQAYPQTLARMQHCLQEEELPEELLGSSDPNIAPAAAANLAMSRIRKLPPQAFAWARVPYEEFVASPANLKKTVQAAGVEVSPLEARALMLECARLWITRALKNQHGAIGLHWLNAPAFKLGVNVGIAG